jgi:hypothetical protein
MNLCGCLKNELMSGRHCVILFMTLCRHKKNDIMSARHYFIFLPTQIHNKNDTPSVKSSIQKITDIMSKKCVAYPQEDFLFIKLITSLRISLLNNCKKDFQFHTERNFFTLNIRFFLHDLLDFHVFGPS